MMARKKTTAKTVTRQATPDPEAVTWTGDNDDDLVDLVRRVQGLHIWAPLEHGELSHVVNQPDVLHPGLNILAGELVVARIEEGNTLVFDPFAETPLFAMIPEHFQVFYGGGA